MDENQHQRSTKETEERKENRKETGLYLLLWMNDESLESISVCVIYHRFTV
jgi:hypothetical protein